MTAMRFLAALLVSLLIVACASPTPASAPASPASTATDDAGSTEVSADATADSEEQVLSPPSPPAPSEPRVVTLDGDVRVDVAAGTVSFPGTIALDEGWLEVGVCRAGTREHEAVVVTGSTPSIVHAGLLLAGLEPGKPGGYHANGSAFGPTGDRVVVELQPLDDAGAPAGDPIPFASTVLDVRSPEEVPDLGWVFAGSQVLPNPPSMGPGEYYAADFGGSLIGLSTFGDEVVGAIEVRSPDSGVDDAVWKIRPGVLPAAGTRVRVVVTRSPERP